MSRKVKKPKFNEVNPDKVSRGHAFGMPGKGRSIYFKDASKYKRKNRRNSKLEN